MSWLPVSVTVDPASEPVSATEAKQQARIDGTDEDALLDIYITASRMAVEEYTGTKLVEQTVLLRCSDWADLVDLPSAPISEITSVKYLDPDGIEQTLSTDVYETVLAGLEPHIRLKVNQGWPSIRSASDAIRVTAVAGYSAVPDPVKAALMLTIAKWVDDRSSGDLPDGAIALLNTNYRRF